ncbi:nascent polypeptide-associated complex protein [Halolamina sp.]|uniref:nascent polypeptide-associated complex protein n=1 Tax=Halolamina sp. TaxID=1940283 RepID=UPI00356AB7A1
MFGGGGLNPRKMQQMMKQMGIDVEDIDAEEVIIRTEDEELVFEAPEVTQMDAQGQQTYQIVGEPDSRPRGDAGAAAAVEGGDGEGESAESGGIPDADVEIVAQRAGVTESTARKTLETHDGDLAAAVSELES